MAKLVDAHALGACGATLAGSIPVPGTVLLFDIFYVFKNYQ